MSFRWEKLKLRVAWNAAWGCSERFRAATTSWGPSYHPAEVPHWNHHDIPTTRHCAGVCVCQSSHHGRPDCSMGRGNGSCLREEEGEVLWTVSCMLPTLVKSFHLFQFTRTPEICRSHSSQKDESSSSSCEGGWARELLSLVLQNGQGVVQRILQQNVMFQE